MDTMQYADLQINGYMGVDFSAPDLTADQFLTAVDRILESGTGLFLPTLITSPPQVYLRNLPLMRQAAEARGLLRHVPGVHLEGPFISPVPGAVGAHMPEFVIPPDTALFDEIMERSGNYAALITVAAEIPGIERFIAHAAAAGVTVSCGHHLAGAPELARAAGAGAKLLTHLGNGCPNTLDRHSNMIWAGMANDDLAAMIIADGHHLPPDVVKCIIRSKGTDRVIVTSDAAPVAGLPPGKYTWSGNDAVLEANGRLHNPEKGCLVGSSVCMKQCAEFLAGMGFCREDIVKMTVTNPLKVLGRSEI